MVVREIAEPLWLAEIPAAEPVRLRTTSTVHDVVQAAIADCLSQLVRFGPGVFYGTDPEDIHKSRVATRKMRSQLRSLSAAVDGKWLQEIRSELGWLADGLGAVRDADVMLLRLRQRAADLPSRDQATANGLIARLGATRDEAAQNVRTMIEGDRCRSLLARLQDGATDPPVLPIGSERAEDLAAPLVSASWRRLERSVSALPRSPSDDDLHEVRIRTKRCRYTVEVLLPVMGADYRRLSRALTELQGVLGDIHDSHGTQTWLRASADSIPEALVAGMIVQAEARDHAALLRSWPSIWAKAQKVNLRSRPNKSKTE